MAAYASDPAREEPLGEEHDREGDPVRPRPPPVMSTPSTCLQQCGVFHDEQWFRLVEDDMSECVVPLCQQQ